LLSVVHGLCKSTCMKRVLLTGAGGFVGHHTLEHLLSNTDWEIVCTDSFQHRGKTDRIRQVLDGQPEHDRVAVLKHDLRAPISKQSAFEIGSIDYVISMASESHVDRSISHPRDFVENNVSIVLSLLDYVRDYPVEKFVHVSTDEVYGPAPAGHDHLEGEPHRPSNPYSASKSCQESICRSYWRTYDLPLAISNTMNIIGERQDPEKFVPSTIKKIREGSTVTCHGSSDGTPGSRFYLHARNQADALLHLLRHVEFPRYSQGNQMEQFNVVGEREVDNVEMALMIAGFMGKPISYQVVDFHSSRPGHDLRYALDGRKMLTCGWQPPVPLESSLQRTVAWTLDHPEWLL
jgi:dTDP-glucose 4,6-dehydratase